MPRPLRPFGRTPWPGKSFCKNPQTSIPSCLRGWRSIGWTTPRGCKPHASRAPGALARSRCRPRLPPGTRLGPGPEGANGFLDAVVDVEDGHQLGDDKLVADFIGEVREFQVGSVAFRRDEACHQCPQASTVDVSDLAHVQDESPLAHAQEVLNLISQVVAFISEDQAARQPDDRHPAQVFFDYLQRHSSSTYACFRGITSIRLLRPRAPRERALYRAPRPL